MSHLHHKVSALVDGELHGSARRRALNHARHCDACRHELRATLALKRRMAGLHAAEPPADLFASLDGLTRVCDTAPTDPASDRAAVARGRLGPVVRRMLVGAGSLSVVVLSLAYAVGGAADGAAPGVTPPVDQYTADFAGDTGLSPLSDPPVEVLAAGDAQSVSQVILNGGAPGALGSYSGAVASGDDVRAVDELRRAVSAPSRFAYHGIRTIVTFDATPATTLRIDVEHTPDQGTSYDVAAGSSDATATFIAERETTDSESLGAAPLDLLVSAYDLALGSSATLLGRSATVIEASRGGVVRARFWIDDVTGLLLRREVYDGGRLVRSTGFTELRVTRDGFLTHLPPELETPPTTQLSMTTAAVLNDDGWTCPGALAPHFALTGLDHLETDGDVMRASYSDGLSTVSLFEQHGSLDPAGLAGFSEVAMTGGDVYTRYGLPTVAVWQADGTVYTLVTDAPHDVAAAVIAGLPHARPQSAGVGDRLGTGLRRIGSFVNLSD